MVALAFAAPACSPGGNGVGTAVGASPACSTIPLPKSGDDCSKIGLKLCCYASDGTLVDNGGSCLGTVVAYCPGGPGAKWQLDTPGDAGMLNDALPVPDTGADFDATDGADAPDGTDGADAADALDAADASDAPETSDAADAKIDGATEAGADAADSASDGGAGDVLPDVAVDVLGG